MFTPTQIKEAISAIDLQYSLIIGMTLGTESLSIEDMLTLQSHGVDVSQIALEHPPYKRMFMLGRLASLLRDDSLYQLNIDYFNLYLKKKQFLPLSSREQRTYDLSREQTYNHLKGLGRRSSDGVRDIMLEINKKNIIKEEISAGVKDRKSVKSVISEIGHKTDEWNRDWHRIVETEMANIFNQGIVGQLVEKYGEEHEVWKQVYKEACRHCISLYTTNGIDSEPKIFKLKDLIGNGNNIGRKVDEWLPVVDATHPFCRCQIYNKFPRQKWDSDLKKFVYVEMSQEERESGKWRRGVIKIKVGDKEFITH